MPRALLSITFIFIIISGNLQTEIKIIVIKILYCDSGFVFHNPQYKFLGLVFV